MKKHCQLIVGEGWMVSTILTDSSNGKKKKSGPTNIGSFLRVI